MKIKQMLKKAALGGLMILGLSGIGCGEEPPSSPKPAETVEICKGVLPPAYEAFLEDNKDITSSLVWANAGSGREGKPFAPDCSKLESLAAHINGDAGLAEPPMPVLIEGWGTGYSEQDAWSMYISHVANSLKLEVEGLLPWSIKNYDAGLLNLIFDGREFIWYSTIDDLYKFNPSEQGGRCGITDWNPKTAVDFLAYKGLLAATQEETIYNLTQWARENLVHQNASTPKDWDSYPGWPPLERILSPPAGERHWMGGCCASATFYAAMLHAVNLPVMRGITILTNSIDPETGMPHARIVFPLQGIALAHGDDAYSFYNRRGVNEVPVERMFYTLDELDSLIDNPAIDNSGSYIPTKGEMASYNASRREIGLAFEHMADTLLSRRAMELLGRAPTGELESALMGYGCNSQMCLWKPIFDAGERAAMTEAIDAALTDIGEGDLDQGSRRLIERLNAYHIP